MNALIVVAVGSTVLAIAAMVLLPGGVVRIAQQLDRLAERRVAKIVEETLVDDDAPIPYELTIHGWGHLNESTETFTPVTDEDYVECARCDGQGMFVSCETGESAYRKCGWCSGTGLRRAS